MTNPSGLRPRNASFSAYLRTGRLTVRQVSGEIETKFNPWHDPDDGRFTFAGGGRFFGAGSRASPVASGFSKPPTQDEARQRLVGSGGDFAGGGDFGGGGSSGGSWGQSELDDPKNYSTYVVKPGDNLTRIARTRRGFRVTDLAELNGVSLSAPLQIGQKLKLPTQAYLEFTRQRAAKIRALALNLALQGKPPIPRGPNDPDFHDINTANPPTIEQQMSAIRETVTLSGYRYQVDYLDRARDIQGEIPPLSEERRSRSAQRNAGGDHRLPEDDGGHYVAPRHGGSKHPINHFAQNLSVNRGAYRVIEDSWDRDKKAGHRVFIHIVPHYHGLSTRPYELFVEWTVDGEKHRRTLPNEKQDKKR